MTVEDRVARHYAQAGLGAAILAAAERAAGEPGSLTQRDLAPVDEFHIGGLEATRHFLPKLGMAAGQRWLDIGSGIGGAARQAAAIHGCQVTGIDLTADYVAAATMLTARVGLTDRVTFRQASALDLPFADGTFDGAYTIHVAMNIEDKPSLYREARRVLKPGTMFGIYDILQGPGGGVPAFPVPWAATGETSFLAPIGDMVAMLEAAGFDIVSQEDRSGFATEFFRQLQKRRESGELPALGLHIVMGADFPAKIGNMVRNLHDGTIAPWEIICRRR